MSKKLEEMTKEEVDAYGMELVQKALEEESFVMRVWIQSVEDRLEDLKNKLKIFEGNH